MAQLPAPPSNSRVNMPRVYAVTPDLAPGLIVPLVKNLIREVDVMIQLRCKSAPDPEFLQLAEQVVTLCRDADRICIINDRLDIAQQAGADGVHLGQTDMSATSARETFDRIVGVTCRTASQARQAEAAGADYIGVGPTFVSSTKTNLPTPLGVAGVAAVASSVDIPVYAIGGIDATSTSELIANNVFGVAVVAALFDQPEASVDRANKLYDAVANGLEHGRANK